MGENTSLFTDLIDTKSAMERTLRKLEESWGREDDLLGLSTGFVDLDQHLLGLQPGVYVIAAGPNIGKTTFVLNVVNNILLEAQRKNEVRVGAIISMEMGVESLSVKLLATRARLSTGISSGGT
jgi:replicative DNA helicase